MKDSELDRLLKTAKTPLHTPAGFQREVWSRIEAADEKIRKPGFHRLLENFVSFFAIPQVAVATCAGMVIAGSWFGLQHEGSSPVSEVAYVQSVSPFAHNPRR